MLTAHLPAGYLFAKALPWREKAVVATALVASILPDLDMFWYHLVDHGTVHHHRYWVHVPFFWACVAAVALPVLILLKRARYGVAFFGAIALHLLLDTIGGGILWKAPFSSELVTLLTVPARYDHWVMSFMLHWTFALEIGIWIAAVLVYLASKQRAERLSARSI